MSITRLTWVLRKDKGSMYSTLICYACGMKPMVSWRRRLRKLMRTKRQSQTCLLGEKQKNSYSVRYQIIWVKNKRASLQQLLTEFKDTLQTRPGQMQVTKHSIHMGEERPVRLLPYWLPYAYQPEDSGKGTERDAEGRDDLEVNEWVVSTDHANHKERRGALFLRQLLETERHLQNG